MTMEVQLTTTQYTQLFYAVRIYTEAVSCIEQIRLPGQDGKYLEDSEHCYFSRKSISHYCLSMALELRLKTFLYLSNTKFSRTHEVSILYKKLPQNIAQKLDDIYLKSLGNETVEFEALAYSEATPDKPSDDPEMDNLEEFCRFCDDFLKLHQKRYLWEGIESGVYEYFLGNLTVFRRFIQMSEDYQSEIAKKVLFKDMAANSSADRMGDKSVHENERK